MGTDLVKKPVRRDRAAEPPLADRIESKANFVSHVGLDWLVLYEGELIKYSDYRKKAVLKTKGLDIDSSGRIVTDSGARLSDTMPAGIYELFLKGLESAAILNLRIDKGWRGLAQTVIRINFDQSLESLSQ